MERYMIILKGCHDDTIFFMSLTNEEKDFLEKIASLSQEFSECDCMPTLEIVDTKTSN